MALLFIKAVTTEVESMQKQEVELQLSWKCPGVLMGFPPVYEGLRFLFGDAAMYTRLSST